MSKKQFKTIGFGYKGKTKAGLPMINLKLDTRALNSMATIDQGKGIYVFEDKLIDDRVTVMAPVNEDYELSATDLFENTGLKKKAVKKSEDNSQN